MPEIQLCGDDLLSVSLDSTSDATSLASALRREIAATEIVPGIDSVVVQFDAATVDSESVASQIRAVLAAGIETTASARPTIEIPVRYGGEDGPDLEAVCQTAGLSADELIALHTSRSYPVELIGFTPGFAFVGDLDKRLSVPRLTEPRQRLAAGSIGIADGRTGIYALSVPGGWQIIGRTDKVLFDPGKNPPNLLDVGSQVRFIAVENTR